MFTKEKQQVLNDSEDMKLAVDSMRAVFKPNGKTKPKHQRALDALARFCKVGAHNYGTDQTEILRIVGRLEVYNYIMLCLEYPMKERHKLAAQITELEETRDGRTGSGRPDDTDRPDND